MSIPKKIIDLTTLALQDRVLTFKERETIAAEALKMGVSQDEIDAYLTDALNTRLQSYTKEELGSCPGCGHGVPLIADQCPYCGTMLQRDGNQVIVPPPHPSSFNVSDEAAQIIQQENINTDQERHKNCPKCGAPYPLVSNICGHCGYVLHEQRDSEFNINTLLENMRTSIAEMKQTLRPSFWGVLKSQIGTLCLFFAAAFFIIGELFDNTNMTMGGCCALPLAIILLSAFNRGEEYKGNTDGLIGWILWFLFGCKASKTSIDEADEQYYKALHSLEQYQRQIDTIYGKDAEARRLLDDYAVEIGGYKKMRNRSRNMIAVLFVAVMAIPFVALAIWTPETVAEKYVSNHSLYPDVYQATDFSKDISLKFYKDKEGKCLATYFNVDDKAEIRLGVLHDNYLLEPENKDVRFQLRVSGVHLRSTGKIFEHPDSCILQGALMSADGDIVGHEFFPFKSFISNSDYNYRTVIGKGKGDVYLDFYAKKGSTSAQRLKEVADSASYFLIF
ncbi:MAG: zinc ribbon domain-containing protein [Bacteroidales bacterium]|nr:zinc ribbon domain-containing protein [Bacteroidales bacterium]